MTEKRKKKEKVISIEELYKNKNFVPPKEKNLETIFEEPRKSKDGAPMMTSVKKFKRYLDFDTTVGKIHKRKVKAKKCMKKMKMGSLKTRSATKVEECQDISLYISEVLGESSDSEMDTTNREINSIDSNQSKLTVDPPQVNRNDLSGGYAKSEYITKKCTTAGDESNTRNNSQKPTSFESETFSNTEHTLLDEMADSNNALEVGEESKETSRSSCTIT